MTVTDYRYHYSLRRRHSDETLREDDRNAAFLKAAAEGQTPRVRYLIQLGADLDHADADGLTALHHAVLCGGEDVITLLLEAGADVNAESNNDGTPLCVAATYDRSNVVEILVKFRADVNYNAQSVGTPLHCALRAGHIRTSLSRADCVTILLNAGAVVDHNDSDVRTLLLLAAEHSDFEKVEQLLKRGADLYAKSSDGTSLLTLAVRMRAARLARIIADHAFHSAAMSGNIALESTLYFVPEDLKALSKQKPPHQLYHLICEEWEDNIENVASIPKGNRFVQMLRGASTKEVPTRSVGRDVTILHRAVELGSKECVEVLLGLGLEVDALTKDSARSTPLHIGVGFNNAAICGLLIEKGADPSRQDSRGSTPLHSAATYGSLAAMTILLQHGASLTSVGWRGYTPLHQAIHLGSVDVVRALLSAGAPTQQCNKDGETSLSLARRVAKVIKDKGLSSVQPVYLEIIKILEAATKGS